MGAAGRGGVGGGGKGWGCGWVGGDFPLELALLRAFAQALLLHLSERCHKSAPRTLQNGCIPLPFLPVVDPTSVWLSLLCVALLSRPTALLHADRPHRSAGSKEKSGCGLFWDKLTPETERDVMLHDSFAREFVFMDPPGPGAWSLSSQPLLTWQRHVPLNRDPSLSTCWLISPACLKVALWCFKSPPPSSLTRFLIGSTWAMWPSGLFFQD